MQGFGKNNTTVVKAILQLSVLYKVSLSLYIFDTQF